jgi:hypothetical protein
MGSISFGTVLVTGRKRVPYPAAIIRPFNVSLLFATVGKTTVNEWKIQLTPHMEPGSPDIDAMVST